MNPAIRNTLLFFALILVAGLAITLIDGGEARTATWDGGSPSTQLASDALNWDGPNTLPVAGDNIVFDGTSVEVCTWDLSTNSFGTFTIAAGYSGTITQSSDMYISGYSQAGGTFTGVTTKWVYCDGSIIKTGGTFTSAKTCLNLTGNGEIRIATSYGENLNKLTISSNCNYTSTYSIFVVNVGDNFLNINGKLNISASLYAYPSGLGQHFIGTGKLEGTGTFQIICYAGLGYRDITFTTDIIIKYVAQGTDGQNHIVQLLRDLTCKGILYDCPGTRILTLDINGSQSHRLIYNRRHPGNSSMWGRNYNRRHNPG